MADVDQNGNVLARYVASDKIDEPLALLRSSTTSYYEADGLGSVTSLTSAEATIANTYSYDSFGKLIGSSGSVANRFAYTAREFDTETGLYLYRARYYDPSAGRFSSEDPIGFRGGINFYTYVKNNPLILFDPTGLAPQSPDPKLPTVPTGKAGCRFDSTDNASPCKKCLYYCRGYGAVINFYQAVEKPCPSIDPVSGLINTSEIDPKCKKPPCQEKPLGAPLLVPLLDLFEEFWWVFAGAA